MGFAIHHHYTKLSDFKALFQSKEPLQFQAESWNEIKRSRLFLEKILSENQRIIYGINTGFGDLCKVAISPADLEQLQINLVRSHACGNGEPLPEHLTRLLMLLKLQSFASGVSCVRPELVEHLLTYINKGLHPVVYENGSLGASGDLVPLAHMALPLIGEGEMWKNGQIVQAADLLKEHNISPIKLKAKEGLALLNGTQFMMALGLDAWWRSQQLISNALAIFSLATDAFSARIDFLDEHIHLARPHKGQLWVANTMMKWLEGSEIAQKEKSQVQDPYSFRCLPQVVGATKDAIDYVGSVLETELNSVTDNPLVFADAEKILSGGNFHGQPLALALDFLGIAMSELANISERILYKLVGGERGLPLFLTQKAGLESGFMITQYSAASLVSQNKQLATPASVDSIVSSNGQEDHVSMGANAALKCRKIVSNTESVLGILWLAGAQALDYKKSEKSSPRLEKLKTLYRKNVQFRNGDASFKEDMDKSIQFVCQHAFEELC